MSQGVGQQGGNVGVDGSVPGVGAGPVFAAQHHRVLAVRGVELQQPEWDQEKLYKLKINYII